MKISIGALLAVSLLFNCHAYAEVSLTTGAGYANMAKELAKTFSETSGSVAVKEKRDGKQCANTDFHYSVLKNRDRFKTSRVFPRRMFFPSEIKSASSVRRKASFGLCVI